MRFIALLASYLLLTSCATVKQLDSSLYGMPPDQLVEDVTVYVSFDDAFSISQRCSTEAFGPVGAIVPSHGCVKAVAGKPVHMYASINGALSGSKRIVQFMSSRRAQRLCDRYGVETDLDASVPEGGCFYKARGEETLRVIWPNPCESPVDLYMCHELGHVNQYANGWKEASLSPGRHWGRPPNRPVFAERHYTSFAMIGSSEPKAASAP